MRKAEQKNAPELPARDHYFKSALRALFMTSGYAKPNGFKQKYRMGHYWMMTVTARRLAGWGQFAPTDPLP